MASPAANIALIILSLFAALAIICWYFKTQVDQFVRNLLEYRRKAHEERDASTSARTA